MKTTTISGSVPMRGRRAPLLVVALIVGAVQVGSQERTPQAERPTIALSELLRTLDQAAAIADDALDLRDRLSTLDRAAFLTEAAPLQRRCEPIVVLIAETSPPREHQQLAMNIAMGIKGIELGLWYFIYGALDGDSSYLEDGDQLFIRGRREIARALELAALLR